MAETEALLLRRFARTRDAEAFAEIVRRHAGLVYSAALRILADVDRAADVAQETFLQLTTDAHRVTGSLPSWLHRVATHKAIDQIRRDTSRRRREADYAADQPREATDWKHLSHHVDEGLNELDSQTREILVAHFLQGHTTRQIALAGAISQATVSRRIDSGVTQLRALLRKRGVLVATAALSTLLGENAIQAAPAALMSELGKMALVGGHAAVASVAATAGGAGVQTVAGGVLAGVKAKAVAVAAVAVIGTGSVVTYRHATRPPSSGNIVITRSARPRARPAAVSPAPPVARSATRVAGPSQGAQGWNQLMSAARNQARSRADGAAPQDPGFPPQVPPAGEAEGPVPPPAAMGSMMGGPAGAPAGTAQPPPEAPTGPPVAAMGFAGGGGAFYAVRVAPTPTEPNDANDPGDGDAE